MALAKFNITPTDKLRDAREKTQQPIRLPLTQLPASVAQLDARPTGDQEVAGSTPAEVGNILSWRLIMKYFLRSFSPFRFIQEGQLSVSGERMHNTC